MAATTETTFDIIEAALRILTVIDEVTSPTAEQSELAIEVLNDMLSNYYVDGIRLGWFPQTLTTYNSIPAPLQDYDTRNIKLLFATELAPHFGIEVGQTLLGLADAAFKALCKRYIKYFDSDLTGLPFSQGGLFGPGRV